MNKLDGLRVSRGIAVGRALTRQEGAAVVARRALRKDAIEKEVARFDRALRDARDSLYDLRRGERAATEITAFIDLYLALLSDPQIARAPRDLIRERHINAEWALDEQIETVRRHFRLVKDPYLRERGDDIRQVAKRILDAMSVRRSPRVRGGRNWIVVAADLSPADVIEMSRRGYAGFVTESGGGNSHAAILARSIGMPGVSGVADATRKIATGDSLIVDSDAGAVVVRPDAETRRRFLDSARQPPPPAAARKQRARTIDGETVRLHANIEIPDEAPEALAAGSDGVGLFRTEFLFLNRDDLPGEEEQFQVYRAVLKKMSPLPVVFRTLDLGADKMPRSDPEIEAAIETAPQNPALGLRAIRLCLAAPRLFARQARAILRAARFGRARILLPMLSAPAELTRARDLIAAAAEQAFESESRARPLPPIGAMIEVPAAVFVMRAFARRLDFFSVGSNDLIQYALAADRGEEKLADLCDPLHPAILRLLTLIVDNARRARKPLTVCGEIAGDPDLAAMLAAMGIRDLSMNIFALAAVRARIRQIDAGALKKPLARLLAAETPEAARAIFEKRFVGA